MQIVIDISEERFKDIQRIAEVQLESNHFQTAEQILAKGIPIEQEPKTGHWIAQDIHNCHTNFRCSECGYIHSFMHLYGKPSADYTYCPNCGAKMEGSDKG